MTKCQCNGEPGFCERHGVFKTAHWKELCRTREDYFEAWEQGCGPGQRGVRAPPPAEDFPPLYRQAWNLAASLAAFVADGFRTVDADQYKHRLGVCDGCEQRRGNRCLKCGCWLSLKAHGRAFQCPLGKWPEV